MENRLFSNDNGAKCISKEEDATISGNGNHSWGFKIAAGCSGVDGGIEWLCKIEK